MDKTKSIDGLSVRRTPKKPVSFSPASKTPELKPASKAKSKPPIKKPVQILKTPEPTVQQEVTPPSADLDLAAAFSSDTPSTTASEDFLKPIKAFDFDMSDFKKELEEKPATKKEKSIKEKPEKKKKEKRKPSKLRRIITWTLLIIVLIIIGLVTWLVFWGNDIIAKITGGQGNVLDLFTFMEPTYEPLKTDANGRTNILAFGTSGYNMEGDEGNGIHDGAQLTDSIMAISLDQNTGDLAMVSLPRDLKASPTCTATGKINEVYWCNNINGDNEQAGAEALATEVGSILGLDFQYYAHLNWGSLVQIVDILGGITITLDEDILDYYWTGAVYEAGTPYTLNGEEALGLARARHGTTSGDFSRGASQQKILIGIKDKVLEKQLSITDLINLASTLGDNLRTNFSVEELKSIAHLSSDFDFNNMRQISLIDPTYLVTTSEINGISYVVPSAGIGNYGKIQAHIAKMTSSDPRVYESYDILVLNGTETYGIASNEQLSLEEDGYTNIQIGDTEEVFTDEHTLYAKADAAPGTKKLLEEKYNLTAKPFDELPESISHDYDFVLVIGGSSEEALEPNE